MEDVVNHPSHYMSASGLEAIDVLEAFFESDPLGWQVGKYILRYKSKHGVQDLKKARWYLNRLIDRLEVPARDDVKINVLHPELPRLSHKQLAHQSSYNISVAA